MERLDENGDGVVNYNEFFKVMRSDLGFDVRMLTRANNKLGELKELMQIYMPSHGDAFRKFDTSGC